MSVTEDLETKRRFLEAIARSGPRGGIHVSDLEYCLRENHFKKVSPKPPTEVQLGYFVDGAARHLILQKLHPGKAEVSVGKWGITGTVDILDGVPIEIKTTRRWKRVINPWFIKRLCRYCVLLGMNEGKLVVQWLNARGDPFTFLHRRFAPDELDAERAEMLANRDRLLEALRTGSAGGLPRFVDPYAGPKKDDPWWKCRGCLYRKECEEEDFEA